MARIRYLKPEFFKDEDVAALPFETRLFFAGLWGLADKAGRLEDRPLRLKAEIFPYDEVDTEICLKQLSQPKNGSGKPFINRYITDGQRYIEIVNWEKHQKPHHTEKESIIPPAPPLTEKGTLKGMEKQLKASTELRNGEVTVKTPLKQFQSIHFTEKQVKDECFKQGLPENEASKIYADYAKRDWKDGAGQAVTDLTACVMNWRLRMPEYSKSEPAKPLSDEEKQQRRRQETREQSEEWLRSKNDEALRDLLKDKSMAHTHGWLIKEILNERKS